jgi:hypothetical protein
MTDPKERGGQIYQAFMIGTVWAYNFHPTERTLSKLHSDGYHLIKDKNAANSIGHLEEQYSQSNMQIDRVLDSILAENHFYFSLLL